MTVELTQTQPTNCVIVGLGVTGLSCARFLVQQGMDVAVLDTRSHPPSLDILQQEYPEVVVRTGELSVEWLLKADQIILSPGVDARLPEIQAAAKAGIEVIGDIELFARHATAPIVAITGSNGKSTVTTLVSLMAQLAGKNAPTGGNLGIPALDLLSDEAVDFYILELSSFQLETTYSLNAFAAVVLNLSDDHLDRYDSVASYQQAKQKIYQGDGVMVVNRDDPLVMSMAQKGRQQIGFSLIEHNADDFGVREIDNSLWLCEGPHQLIAVSEMKLAGKHNLANALAALALGSVMGLPMFAMLSALREFKGLPHRCRFVRERRGVRWYNDSKATNIGASVAAIEGLADNGKIVLIAGGQGKQQDFTLLKLVLTQSVSQLILMGEAAEEMAAVVSDIPVVMVKTMKEAVITAAKLAQAGEQVLLSPACASQDMFKDYADRGHQFEQSVRELQP